MSRVDVYAVLDHADDVLISTGREDMHSLAGDLALVRQAFDELLQTGVRTTSAFRAHGAAYGIVEEARTRQGCESALLAFDTALTRIGGGA